jgi:hypothetical protein
VTPPAGDTVMRGLAWLRDLDRLPVTLVLPTHGPPAPDGPGLVRDALARPPSTLFGSG